jgi:mannose-6-phosphate isomerase
MIDTTASPPVDDSEEAFNQALLYPLRFEPIYQYRLWGGRRFADLLRAPLPSGPVGEAWLLSDRDDHASEVADGPLKGQTIGQLLKQFPEQMMGKLARNFRRFPLLLKFLDVREMLSVQVHPTKANKNLLPPGETEKTEAWVVLQAGTQSQIFAGLKTGTTEAGLRLALKKKTMVELLAGFTPKLGDAIFCRAGTVHSLGDVVVFEIQQNSDVTFRLYDWDHVDPKTGKLRALDVEKAIACIDFAKGPVGVVAPVVEATVPVQRERLFDCEHFLLWRLRGNAPFAVGAPGVLRVLVCIGGEGEVEHSGASYAVRKGDVFLLPAVIGVCTFRPSTEVSLLEIALPDCDGRAEDKDQKVETF